MRPCDPRSRGSRSAGAGATSEISPVVAGPIHAGSDMTAAAKNRCFVIAPIGEEDSETRRRSDQVLRYIITPVVEEHGYAPTRADQISEPGLITGQAIQRIVEDPLVVADLSEWNPNVFYELALRHALRKPLVQIIAAGERIPFDVAAMRTVQFDLKDLDSVERAKAEIGRQIEALERNPESVETPVSVTLDVHALRQSGDPEERSIAELVTAVAQLRAEARDAAERSESILRAIHRREVPSALVTDTDVEARLVALLSPIEGESSKEFDRRKRAIRNVLPYLREARGMGSLHSPMPRMEDFQESIGGVRGALRGGRHPPPA